MPVSEKRLIRAEHPSDASIYGLRLAILLACIGLNVVYYSGYLKPRSYGDFSPEGLYRYRVLAWMIFAAAGGLAVWKVGH